MVLLVETCRIERWEGVRTLSSVSVSLIPRLFLHSGSGGEILTKIEGEMSNTHPKCYPKVWIPFLLPDSRKKRSTRGRELVYGAQTGLNGPRGAHGEPQGPIGPLEFMGPLGPMEPLGLWAHGDHVVHGAHMPHRCQNHSWIGRPTTKVPREDVGVGTPPPTPKVGGWEAYSSQLKSPKGYQNSPG